MVLKSQTADLLTTYLNDDAFFQFVRVNHLPSEHKFSPESGNTGGGLYDPRALSSIAIKIIPPQKHYFIKINSSKVELHTKKPQIFIP
jgi:hypothetical protein